MSTTITTTPQNVNRFSDFEMTMTMMLDGQAFVPDNFILAFSVDNCEPYIASRIDGECVNCAIEGTTITIYFDHPCFPLGEMQCRLVNKSDNDNFSDGYLDTCIPFPIPVNIVAGAGDEVIDVTIDLPSGGGGTPATAEEVNAQCDNVLN